jgi:hypothetical protein
MIDFGNTSIVMDFGNQFAGVTPSEINPMNVRAEVAEQESSSFVRDDYGSLICSVVFSFMFTFMSFFWFPAYLSHNSSLCLNYSVRVVFSLQIAFIRNRFRTDAH